MRDLQRLARWLLNELHTLLGMLREPQIWLALVVGLLVWTLAYQVPYAYRLDLGGNLVTQRRYDDEPFLDNFNAPEPEPIPEQATLLYRWSSDASSIIFPGVGGGTWLVRINAGSGSRPAPLPSRWDSGTQSYQIGISNVQRDYQIVAAADNAGDLVLRFTTPPLTPPGDPRILGLVMSRVQISPISGARWPALRQLALLTLSLALLYAIQRRFALNSRATLLSTLALAVLVALLLVYQRMALTLLTPVLPSILAGCYLFGIVLQAFSASLPLYDPPQRQASSRHPSLIIGLIVLAAALRIGGMLHPHARFSDDGLNANNLIGFIQGSVFFTEGLPARLGGGQAPYPPGQYVLFAPAQLIFANDFVALKRLLGVGNAVLDSLVVGGMWYMLRRNGFGQRTALLGAALYVLPPPLLKSFSIGEFANIFGQAFAFPVFMLLSTQALTQSPKPFLLALVALLSLALLGHLGITIALFCMLACLLLIWLSNPATRRTGWILLAGGVLAGIGIGLLYYTALWDVIIGRVTDLPVENNLGAKPSVRQQIIQQVGYLQVYGIHSLVLVSGAIGALLILPRWHALPAQATLKPVLLAWWIGTFLALLPLIFASQSVRWYLFIYPALCLGGGITLARFWQRGRTGRIVASTLLAFLLYDGLAFWITQLANYLH